MAAFSIKAIIIGVARTGMSPEPTAIAVTASVTVNSLEYFSPVSIISSLTILILRCKFTKSAEKTLTLQAKFALLLQKSGEHQLLSGEYQLLSGEYQLSSLREYAYD
jgi:hypothetical protein